MTKAIIYDFDGTLANTRHVMMKIYPQVAEKHNFKVLAEDELDRLKSRPFRERLKKMGIPVSKLPAVIKETRELCGNHMELCTPFEGIPEVLNTLREKGFYQGIISSNKQESIRSFLDNHQIDFFQNIITTHGLFGKHTVIKKFLKQEGFAKEDIIYVGDEVRDIVSCKKAGIRVIAVTWGYDDISILRDEEPDYLVETPGEILNIF